MKDLTGQPATVNKSSVVFDPEQRLKLQRALSDLTHYLRQLDDIRAGFKDSIAGVAEEYCLDKKLVRQLVKTMYKADYDVQVESRRQFEQLFEVITEGKYRDEPEE